MKPFLPILKAVWSVTHYFIAFIGILTMAKALGVAPESEPWKLLVILGTLSMMFVFAWEFTDGLEE